MVSNSTNFKYSSSWIRIEFGKILSLEYGKGLTKKKRKHGTVPVYGSNGIVGYHSENLVGNKGIIIGRKGAVGKVHLSKTPFWPIDTTYYLIPPTQVNISFLYYMLKNFSFKQFEKSTAIPGLNRDDAYSLKIIIASIHEQKNIVERIEKLFEKLDAGVEGLERVKTQLKRYRQAVLKAAFEGKLTTDWRQRMLSNELRVLSEEDQYYNDKTLWNIDELQNISDINPKLSTELLEDIGVSFLPMKAVEVETGKIDLSITKKYSEVKKGYTSFENGDLIFAKITPCMENGKIAIVENLMNGVGFGSTEFHVIRVNIDKIYNKFLFYYLIQKATRKDAKHNMTGTAGQLRVPKKYVELLKFSYPSLEMQKIIVEEIERKFEKADGVEKVVDESLGKAKQLRQSILREAFNGNLTKKWREEHQGLISGENSAQALLEKIKKEREKGKQKKINFNRG